MDRTIVYAGAIPQDTDILSAQTYAMSALGYAVQSMMGTNPYVSGLLAIPTAPTSLSVTVTPGTLGSLQMIDSQPFARLGVNSDAMVKIGTNSRPTPLTFVAPASAGQSQIFVIQVSLDEHDDLALVLPYYNAANPAIGLAGPGNSNVPQATRRVCRALVSVKAGVPAASGSQAIPAVDVGNLGLWLVTLANGQTTIAATDIAAHPQSPSLPWTLPQVGPTVGQGRAYTTPGIYYWTAPPGVVRAKLSIIGAGGAGGSSTDNRYAGGGGGGGGTAIGPIVVQPGAVYQVIVAAGNAGVVQPVPTTFNSGATPLIFATSGSIGTTGGAGGVGLGGGGGSGFGGLFNRVGTPGTSGITNPGGQSEGGMGGTASYGAGSSRAAGGYGTSWSGAPGFSPGGGSSGCTLSNAAGGNGEVVIEW